MFLKIVSLFAVILVTLALLSGDAYASSASSLYRKPPVNGSIFGKRGSGTSTDAVPRGSAFPVLCEVALEACSSWMAAVEYSYKAMGRGTSSLILTVHERDL